MKSSLIDIIDKLASKPRIMFLVDGLGACLSAFLLGVVIYNLENTFGMPKDVLFYLAIAPCFFAIYSFRCYLLNSTKWRSLLKIIAIANLIYCIISAIMICQHYSLLTILGIIYFVVEIIIVAYISKVELNIANSNYIYN